MRAREHDRLDIRRKLLQIFVEQFLDLISFRDARFDQRDESWGTDFFHDDRIIEDFYTFFIRTRPYRRFGREDTDFFISFFYDFLGSWDHDTENIAIWKNLLLKESKCMD